MKEFFTHQEVVFQAEMFLRIILAAICGAGIGYERKKRGKGAGIRTHMVVALASSLMMLISKYGFRDMAQFAADSGFNHRVDVSRIAAQIVSGVGFLGAGTIYFWHNNVKGLTTAAGIWATAGIGMAIGAGMYIIGVLSSLVIIVLQILLHRDIAFLHILNEDYIKITIKNSDEALAYVKTKLAENGIHTENLSYKVIDDTVELKLTVVSQMSLDAEKLLDITRENDYILGIDI